MAEATGGRRLVQTVGGDQGDMQQGRRVVGRRSAGKVARGEVGLWQRRFREDHLRDEADFAAQVRYLWAEPVEHGLVARAVDWPLSSIHRDVRFGRVEPEWAGDVMEGNFGK